MWSDYSGIKRSLHRKIKDAKVKGEDKLEISLDYLINVSKVYDELLDENRRLKNPKFGKWVEIRGDKLVEM